MIRRRGRVRGGNDLPFERDQSTRFLPWIIAPMVFLAIMSLAAVEIVGLVVDSWDAEIRGNMTIQVPQIPGQDNGPRIDRALAFAVATPGVETAQPLDPQIALGLLEPWLGEVTVELPLPAIIDVTLEPGAVLDVEIFAEQLAKIVDGALVDDHRVWLQGLIDLADWVMRAAFCALVLVTASAASSVIYATRSSLLVHGQIIDLLHYMGAYDEYIARQFQRHAMRLCARGGLWGAGLAALFLGMLFYAGRNIEATMLPPIVLSVAQLLSLAAVPVATIIIGVVTSRVTVVKALARLP